MPIRWHEDTPDDLRAAIRFAAETSGFLPRLLEKDCFCSVVPEAFAQVDMPLGAQPWPRSTRASSA